MLFAPCGSFAYTMCNMAQSSCGPIETYSNANGTPNSALLGSSAATTYVSFAFTGNGDTVKTVYINLKKTNSGQDVQLAICTNSSGSPSQTCVNADSVISATNITSTYDVPIKVNFASGYATTNATLYWIRLQSLAQSGSNYDYAQFDSSGGTGVKSSETGASWSNVDSTARGYYSVTSCLE